MSRPGLVTVVALVSAFLGAAVALAVAAAIGWVGERPGETVVVPAAGGASPPPTPIDESQVAKPLPGNEFDPARIYRERAAGVVTILALFGDEPRGDAAVSQGSGFVVSRDGHILTNSHVVTTAGEDGASSRPVAAESVFVEFWDGDRVRADVVGWDIYIDLALLEVDTSEHRLRPVPLGDSSRVAVGEPVAAIGSPFGNENSLAVGVVAATKRSIASLTSRYSLVDAIQTDAPINRGNSGGPLFNARGEVIGITAQIRSETGRAEGVGFAIPINSASRSMRQLIDTGRVRYAWLGVSAETLTPGLARHFGYSVERGAAIQEVVERSPADRAGLRGGGREEHFEGLFLRPGGDVVVAVDRTPVRSAEDLVRVISEGLLPGQRAVFSVVRGSEQLEILVVLGERPAVLPGTDR